VPAPLCTEPDCSLENSRVLLRHEAAYSRDGQPQRFPCEFRLCDRCHMGFVHPAPAPDVLACFYTGDYAYYQAAGRHPAAEARSWKYKLAGMRYRHRLAPGAANRLLAAAAGGVERLARRTVTYTLGVPLALPKSARILDYGYGTGSWLASMRLLGYSNLLGYDIASNTQRAGEIAALGIQAIPADGLSALPAASLDCVRLEHVFEHLPDPLAVLRSLHRLLRPRGLLVMTFPTIYPWLPFEKDLASCPFLDYLQLPIHLAHHSDESALRLLRAAGFEEIASRVTAREQFLTLMARKALVADL
jgi:SAM-dependent methyltransferase